MDLSLKHYQDLLERRKRDLAECEQRNDKVRAEVIRKQIASMEFRLIDMEAIQRLDAALHEHQKSERVMQEM